MNKLTLMVLIVSACCSIAACNAPSTDASVPESAASSPAKASSVWKMNTHADDNVKPFYPSAGSGPSSTSSAPARKAN